MVLLEVVTLGAVLVREVCPFVTVGLLGRLYFPGLLLLGVFPSCVELGKQGAALLVVGSVERLDGRLVLRFERGEELAFLSFLSGDELARAPVLRHNFIEHAGQVALMLLPLFANGCLGGGFEVLGESSKPLLMLLHELSPRAALLVEERFYLRFVVHLESGGESAKLGFVLLAKGGAVFLVLVPSVGGQGADFT